jgi:fatty-acyl-CoA synthase/long-chain acyl-CoA synthetase
MVALMYTSGTTGAPKGSMHTHQTILFPLTIDLLKSPTFTQMLRMVKRYGFRYLIRLLKVYGKPISILYTTPPYTGGGLVTIFNFVLSGRIVVLQDRFTPVGAMQLIERERVSVFGAVPALATLFLRDPRLKDHDLSSLIYIAFGASFVSPALVQEVKDKTGCPAMNVYGATEYVGPPAQTNPFTDSDNALHETVGRVSEGYQIKIVDENRHPVPTAEVGEIAVKGKSMMLGYYKAEELTRQVLDEEGWYYTGDLGSMDEEGYLKIVGRKKDMIIRAGQNIYPAELEKVLITHSKIHMVAIIGVPDDIAGEVVVAFIIPKEGVELSFLEVMDFCREHLAAYKQPRDVHFVKEFPLTTTGKVLKRELRTKYLEELRRS